jgi:hypothetical protein
VLVTLENLYGYGSSGGKPMTEDHPLAATSVKGRTRAAMTRELLAAAEAGRVRIAIGRASDFFGAGATETALGSRVFANALAGKRPTSSANSIFSIPTATFPTLRTASRHSVAMSEPSAVRGTCPVRRPSRPERSSSS